MAHPITCRTCGFAGRLKMEKIRSDMGGPLMVRVSCPSCSTVRDLSTGESRLWLARGRRIWEIG
jgi:hypothetical protein